MRILVVDADEQYRHAVAEQLKGEDFEQVQDTASGEDAIRILSTSLASRKPYDAVLLGVGLPDRPGLDAFDEIRSIFDLPIVLIVDRTQKPVAIEGMGRGAEDYVLRLSDLRVLQLKVERLLTRRFLTHELRRSTVRSETLFLNVLAVMAKVLEAKDPYTRFHSEKVSQLSSAVAREMGFNDEEIRRIGIAGILHDLGKIGIKESILMKPGPLDPKEREVVQRHPMIASTILEPIEQLQGALGYIKYHHEHYDGSGYPERLKGEEIPLGARIIHVTEAYDAMISRRSYSVPRSSEDALKELKACVGSQFDPHVVEALKKILGRSVKTITEDQGRPGRSLADLLKDLTGRVAIDDANAGDSGFRKAT